MPTKYDDTNRGFLFKKEDRTNEKSPQYEGKINVDGKDYRIVAWIKESKAGKKYFSLSVSDPKGKVVPAGREPENPRPEPPVIDFVDELPF